jgi:NhaP-type Na+/H+ and K+/H+ antiporter
VFAVIVVVFLSVLVVSVGVGLLAGSLGSVGRAFVQWALDSALAPITALSASVLYFALLG